MKMRILYIFGNGLDLACGLATSYPQFYEYLKDVNPKSLLLNKMLERIGLDKKLWSDMELGLGDFSLQTDDSEEFIKFYKELNNHLRDYLKMEQDGFHPSKAFKEKFTDDLLHPFKYLIGTDSIRFHEITLKYDAHDVLYDYITLNYTNTLEKICAENESVPNGKLLHAHGTLDSNLTFGVDNENQISNEKFRQVARFNEFMIKRQALIAMKHSILTECGDLISHADIIILYGVSLGETDGYLWQMIKSRLKNINRPIIIQHIYGEEIDYRFPQEIADVERGAKSTFMERLKVTKDDNIHLTNNFFILVDKGMFASK